MFELIVPATSSNLGPGFDSLGIALNLYNKFRFEKIKSGLEIKLINEEGKRKFNLSRKENLVYTAIKKLFKHYQQPLEGLRIIERISIPFSRGLGSSATAIIAGLVGGNKLLGNPLTEDEIIKLAVDLEGHPDNIIPALKGGFTVNVLENDLTYKRTEINDSLKIVLVIPKFQLNTNDLRKVLPAKINFNDAVSNHSRTALLTACFFDQDWNKLQIAMKDRLHQDYRAKLIPGFNKVITGAYKAGALGVALSGAGPTILAFTQNNAVDIGKTMVNIFFDNNIKSRYIITTIDNSGIKELEVEGEIKID